MLFLRSISLFLILSATLFIGSCSEKSIPVEYSEVEENNQQTDAVAQITVTGSFRSVEGVMDKLSCFCSHGGYIKTEDGDRISVCFKETIESCDKITVTGYMNSRSIEANGACSEGIMSFLKVQSYIIGETDF